MLTRTLAAASVAALALSPALAQSTNQTVTPKETPAASTSLPQNQTQMRFLQRQSADDWRSSKLVGTSVMGANDQNIGEINDVLFDSGGTVKGVVVGVGGFLGIGEKDVAVPFRALNITRKSGDDAIDKITVSYTKEQLKDAPAFTYLADVKDGVGSARQSTGSGSASPAQR
jgi:sporulation protein YlmC with PRC-barrel domain